MTNIPKTIKACLFDMDGTLLNTEDLYTECSNLLLAEFGKGPLTWDFKIQLQGRPGPESTKLMIANYELPVTVEEFTERVTKIQTKIWPKADFLPGALDLLHYLKDKSFPIALGTSSNKINYQKKTNHLQEGFSLFDSHIVTGDDERIPPGKGKPKPDIWYACLQSLNSTREKDNLDPIKIEECLIFEDGVPGVLSGKAANAYVIWIPDPNAIAVLNGKENEIIGDHGEILKSLLDFDKTKFSL